MRATRTLVCGAVIALLPLAAMAGEQANAPTATGETGLFTLISGDTLPQGQWSFGLYFNNWDRVFEFDDTADSDWSRLSASFGYGITDDFEISVMVPWESYDLEFPGAGSDNEDGLGNVRINGKYSFHQDAARSFAINFFIEAPTGDDEVLAGGTGGGVGLGWRNGNWVYDLGYRVPGADTPAGFPDLSDEIHAGLGYAGAVSDQLDWITELNATLPVDSGDAIFQESIDLTTGGRYWFGADGNWAFNFGLRTDILQLADLDDHCPIGGLLGLTFFPRRFEPVREIPAPIAYELRVDKEGNCDGMVTSSPAGIDCGADCSEIYNEGTVVTLTATPDAKCTFEGWSGDADCSDGTVTMNGDRYCIASFAAVPAPPPPPAPAKPVEERVTIEFPSGARLTNIAKAKLDEVALKLKQDGDMRALVIGYSDSTGSSSANQRISQQRAQAVKTYLVTRHGIDPSRITTEGRGSADPVGDNTTSAGRTQNRRAVVILTTQ